MGCLASCCGGGEEKLVQMKQLDSPVRVQSVSKDVKMDPSGLELSGHGIGLGSEALEQDSSYWEVHVKACAEGAVLGCGVARREEPDKLLKQDFGNGASSWGFKTNTAGVVLTAGDVVGVSFAQSEMPMLQFFLNGERISGTQVDRVRGDVYPAVYVSNGIVITMAFCKSRFKFGSKFSEILITNNVL